MSLSPYWQQQVDPFMGAGRTIGMGIAQLPMMRAMAANRAAQGQFYQAHAGQEQAAAEEAQARADQIRQTIETQFGKTQSGRKLSEVLSKSVMINADPTTTPEQRRAVDAEAMGALGDLASESPEKALEMARSLTQMGQASPTDQVQQANALNPSHPVTTSDVLNDQQLQAAQAAKIQQETRPPAGQLSSRVITIKHPAVPDQAAVPGPTHWFKPNEPGTPAVPGTPEWTEEIKGPTDGSPTAMTQFSQDPRLGPVLKQILPGTQTATSPQNDQSGAAIAPQAETATAQPSAQPQPQHVAYLLQHPELAQQFDQKFGPGSAAKVLASAQQPATANAQ